MKILPNYLLHVAHFKRYFQAYLVNELVEGVLPVSTWLTKVNLACTGSITTYSQ
jgi:hypothetical protein